jgi:integrase
VATYRKRCGKWQAIIRHKNIGTQARTFVQKSSAIKWALEQEKRLDNGTFGKILPSEITLGQLLTRYSEEITPKKRGAVTEQRRLKRLIEDPVSNLQLALLTNMALASFRNRRLSDGKRTCLYDIVLIRHCIKIACNEWGLQLDTNQADNISLPPSEKPRARRLLDSEWEQLQEASNLNRNPHIWPVICFALHTGMRRGEILNLQWADINFE